MPQVDLPKITDLLEGVVDKLVGWVQTLVVMLPNIVVATLVIAIAWIVSKWIAKTVPRVLFRVTRNRPISNLMGTVARLAVSLIGIFFALGLLNLDKTVTSLIAGVGVVGLALGFAFQDIAANFMSGLMMALNRPFRPEDQVEVAGQLGRVKAVELRATTIETLDGLELLVPNKEIFQNAIINYTSTPKRRLEISVGTAYSDDMAEVERVVIDALDGLETRDTSKDIEVLFDEFGSSSINLSALVWLSKSDQMTYRKARSDGMMRIKRAFDEAGISIPFPIRTLDFGAGEVGGVPIHSLRETSQDENGSDG